MKLESLTTDQTAQLAAWRVEWLRVVCNTAPADRPRTEAAISALYEDIGEVPPAFVWVESPPAAFVALGWMAAMPARAPFNERFGDRTSIELRARLRDAIQSWWWEPGRDNFGGEVWDQVGADVGRQLSAELVGPITAQQAPQPIWDRAFGTRFYQDELVDRLWDEIGPGTIDGRPVSRRDWARRVSNDIEIRMNRARNEAIAWEEDSGNDWAGDSWLGRADPLAGEIARYTFARDVLRTTHTAANLRRLELWEQIVRGCAFWWPLKGSCVLSDRPRACHTDLGGRLHHPSEAALQFRDGFRVYMWRGLPVSSTWIEHPERIDPQVALTGGNVEYRRAAAEIVGWSRVLERLSPHTIDKDDDPAIGELIEVQFPPHPHSDRFDNHSYISFEPARFLRVRCATGRMFVLAVPREMQTAREANAWTYGLGPEEFELEART